jgi:hypothetical protein
MSEPIVYEQLLEMSGGETEADVKRFLHKNRIRYFKGKAGRPSTTGRALDVALGVEQQSSTQPDEQIEF